MNNGNDDAQPPHLPPISGEEVSIPTRADRITFISALPVGQRGSEIKQKQRFVTIDSETSGGKATVKVSEEPVWIIEGDLPWVENLTKENSPFGFHPAAVDGNDYSYASDIGVVWDRSGVIRDRTYLLWIFGQPDPSVDRYEWEAFDRYIKELPTDMRAMRNITVVHDAMISPMPGRQVRVLPARPGGLPPNRPGGLPPNRPGGLPPNRPGELPPNQGGEREEFDVSRHVANTSSYLPSDRAAYSRWVTAVVERYDGDGYNDMPELRTPIKYWQIDNEPSQRREGYAELVRLTSSAIKQADPTAQVLIGGFVLPYERYTKDAWPILEELYGESIDILDLHYFGHVGDWKDLADTLIRIQNELSSFGFNELPIWMTEMGTYSGHPSSNRKEERPVQSERQQASEMIKRYAVALGEGVKKVFWAWGMIEGLGNTQDNDFFDNTGFIYDGIGEDDPGSGTKKIVYWTYRKMTELLNFWDGSQPEKLSVGDNITAYRFPFNKNDSRGIIIAWSHD